VRLEVTDEGPGVPGELVDKIFEPLFTTRARGMGLGLSVSRALAKNNGGELSVRSPSGGGATFSLVLPALAHSRQPSS
jgi:signal transduction histidine kinase